MYKFFLSFFAFLLTIKKFILLSTLYVYCFQLYMLLDLLAHQMYNFINFEKGF